MWCSDNLADSIARSIAQMEGYHTPGTLAARNRNPGNLTDPSTGQFRVFASDADGISALCRQVDRNIGRGLTLEEFFGGRPGVYPGYAPAGHGGNDPAAYAAFVGARAGIPVNVSLVDLAGGGGSSWLDVTAADDDLLLIGAVGLGAIALLVAFT